MSASRLVYSTDGGDRRRHARGDEKRGPQQPDDGVVRVSREHAGRRGKTVTVVRGLPPADVSPVAADLKRRCGSGGSVKAGAVELQGDHRDKVVALLRSRGYRVKLAGG